LKKGGEISKKILLIGKLSKDLIRETKLKNLHIIPKKLG
jgi:hypothetical protein